MFICDKCLEEKFVGNSLTDFVGRSLGRCEVCEAHGICVNIHHNRLEPKDSGAGEYEIGFELSSKPEGSTGKFISHFESEVLARSFAEQYNQRTNRLFRYWFIGKVAK